MPIAGYRNNDPNLPNTAAVPIQHGLATIDMRQIAEHQIAHSVALLVPPVADAHHHRSLTRR
jgi:hypothetical protein